MTVKLSKMSAKDENMVYLVENEEAKETLGEAFASFMLNPTVTWAKFVLTDDRTNGNGERIPKEEFTNLINTGINMPVKMAMGEIAPGHDDSKPLGVITNLKEIQTESGASAIVALAALWGEERPADISFIKEKFAQQQPVNVSWEILYQDTVLNETVGSMDLVSTVLKAATIVGNPAYMGRTPFLSIAAKKADAGAKEGTPEDITQEETMEDDTVEKELQEKLDKAVAEIETLKGQLSEKETAIAELTTQKETLEAELTPLKEFKEQADAAVAKAEKLASIKTKFSEAGLNKDEEYFKTNEEKLLGLDTNALDFMVSELKVAAKGGKTEASGKTDKTEIPALHSDDDGSTPSISDLAAHLRSKGKK
jgi:hypothetical protein